MSEVIERMVEQGKLDTVASAMGDKPEPPAAFVLPVLEGYPHRPFSPGIYFGMSDEDYHAVPALSCSGIHKLASSPMLYWATTPWLNENIEPREEKAHFAIGKAYHARILEGADVFHKRFYIALDKAAIEGLLTTTEEIQGAIFKADGEPISRVPTGETKTGKQGEVAVTRAAKKEDWVAQLLGLNPDAPIWEHLQRRHEEANAGKEPLPFDIVTRIETAAKMIEVHAELSRVLRGGHPEVSLFWTCPKTGVPMKARADYLKRKGIVDLKSYENKFELSPENAINKSIANRRYTIQPSVYFEGAEQVRKLVRETEGACIRAGDGTTANNEQREWAIKWAEYRDHDEWLWIFQQKGPAPITRGVQYLRGGSLKMISDEIVSRMKRRFRTFAESFGTDAWLDVEPIYDLADEDLPPWATEI